jgi:hypothetical protein
MRRALEAIPAFAAALLLAILPACKLAPWMYPPAVESAGPIENPHITARVAPRDPDLPARIERQAGEYDPPGADACMYLFWFFVYAVYGFCWCVVELVELICEALASDTEVEEVQGVAETADHG